MNEIHWALEALKRCEVYSENIHTYGNGKGDLTALEADLRNIRALLEAQKVEGSELPTDGSTLLPGGLLRPWGMADRIKFGLSEGKDSAWVSDQLRDWTNAIVLYLTTHPATDSSTAGEGDVDAVADFLYSIGWNSPADGQWSRLKANLSKLGRLALAGAPGQTHVSFPRIAETMERVKRESTDDPSWANMRQRMAKAIEALQLPAPVFDEGVVSREEIAQGLIKWSDDWGDTSGQGWDELLTAVGALQLRHPRDLGGVEPIGWTWENLGKRVFSETKPRFTPIAGTFADLPEVHPVYLAPTPRLAQAESVMDKLWHEINVLSLSAKNADWESFDAAMEIAQAILSRLTESRPVVSEEDIASLKDGW